MKSHIFFFLQQITCCYLVYRHATQPVRSYFPNQGLNTPNQGFNCGALAMRARSPNHSSIREFLAAMCCTNKNVREQDLGVMTLSSAIFLHHVRVFGALPALT